jgi:hypothetical protein
MRIQFRFEPRDPMTFPNAGNPGAQAPPPGSSHTVRAAIAFAALAMTWQRCTSRGVMGR